VGVLVQDVAREQRHQGVVVEEERADGHDEAHHQRDPRGAQRVSHPLGDLVAHGAAAARPRQPLRVQRQQCRDHGQERHAVEEEGGGRPPASDDETGQSGTHDASGVEHGGIQRDGASQGLASDHLDDECLAGRHVHGVGHAVDPGHHGDVPVPGVAAVDQRGEQQGQHAHHRLGGDEQAALGQAISQRAGEERQDEHRCELQCADQPQEERRVGQLEHQPGLGDGLHPRSDQ
jgi:hypothetical protein